jgi:hypothetical protein
MSRRLLYVVVFVVALAVPVGGAFAKNKDNESVDADNNGYPDAGVVVNTNYTSIYAYDANGDYYWDLGDGRIQGTVGSIDDLDPATLSWCDYVINTRGTFENDPFQDTGWIQNHIVCDGYDGHATYNYLIVHETDPRYTGNPDWAIWGNWEYKVLTESGNGNLVRPISAQP